MSTPPSTHMIFHLKHHPNDNVVVFPVGNTLEGKAH